MQFEKEHILLFVLVGLLCLGVGWRTSVQSRPIFHFGPPQNVEYKNHLTGLNVGLLDVGSYSYQLQITNPYDNISVMVYSFLYSDQQGSATLDCSVRNGTEIQPLKSVLAVYDLTVHGQDEFYIRVGCLKEGEDY